MLVTRPCGRCGHDGHSLGTALTWSIHGGGWPGGEA